MVSSYIKKHIAEKQDCNRTLTHTMKGTWYFIFMELRLLWFYPRLMTILFIVLYAVLQIIWRMINAVIAGIR